MQQTVMKRCLMVLTLLGVGALTAELQTTVDATDVDQVQKELSDMMAKSNLRLQRAERHHQRTVNKQRAAIAKDFDSMSGQISAMVEHFEASLVAAEARLEATINASQAAVEEAAKAPGGNDWQGAAFEQKVTLGAQAAAARRGLKHARQSRLTQVHMAENHAEEALEDETQSLGLVVGDLSSELTAAKTAIEGNVTELEESGNMTRDAVAAAPKAAKLPMAKTVEEEKHRLGALQTSLAASVKAQKAAATVAQKALDNAIAAEAKAQQEKAEAVKKAIKDSEKKEAKAVAGKKTDVLKLSHKKKSGAKTESKAKGKAEKSNPKKH